MQLKVFYYVTLKVPLSVLGIMYYNQYLLWPIIEHSARGNANN